MNLDPNDLHNQSASPILYFLSEASTRKILSHLNWELTARTQWYNSINRDIREINNTLHSRRARHQHLLHRHQEYFNQVSNTLQQLYLEREAAKYLVDSHRNLIEFINIRYQSDLYRLPSRSLANEPPTPLIPLPPENPAIADNPPQNSDNSSHSSHSQQEDLHAQP